MTSINPIQEDVQISNEKTSKTIAVDSFSTIGSNDIQKANEEIIRFKVQEFSREYLYKLFTNSFTVIGALVVAVVIGMITYNNHMNDKLQDTYKEVYQAHGDILLLHHKNKELERGISQLEQEITALKEENIILRRQQGRGESK